MDRSMEKGCKAILKRYREEEGNVISILQDLQKVFGHIPREAVYWFSERLNIPASNFFGVATFYSQFHLKPRGRHLITACCGTACHVKGSEPIVLRLREDLRLPAGQETTRDMRFTLEGVACMGACSMAPVIRINKRVYGNMTPDSAVDLLEEFKGRKRR
jgi:NADH:ubiquinone oxidoreductase subunit E